MNAQRTFIEELKYQYRYGGNTVQLIFINVAVFLTIQILLAANRLASLNEWNFVTDFFSLNTDLSIFIRSPYTLITSIFSHFTILHLLFNMLFLYFSGTLFEQLFDKSRLIYTYFLGGILGGIFELIAHLIFPTLQFSQGSLIVGASGSIMALFTALSFYRPDIEVRLFNIFPVKLIYLALFFILMDIVTLGIDDGTAHFAHLGGALLGIWSIQKLNSASNVIFISQKLNNKMINFFRNLFSGNRKLKVKKGGKSRSTQFKSDEQYNLEKKLKQEKIDIILEKISKSGYESLTKAEKDFLFSQSNNG
jgi:membrane associated rhomboid family serine protease